MTRTCCFAVFCSTDTKARPWTRRHYFSADLCSLQSKTFFTICFAVNTVQSPHRIKYTFNHWAQDVLLLEAGKNGVWKIEIPMLAQGTYKYKFFVDDKMWVEDVENPLREPDGFTGWNSLLIV